MEKTDAGLGPATGYSRHRMKNYLDGPVISKITIFAGCARFMLEGCHVGIALYPDDGEDMDQLIKLADEAMYRIKKSGKNGFSFIHTA